MFKITNTNINLTHKYLICRIVICFYSTLNVLTWHILYMHYVVFTFIFLGGCFFFKENKSKSK